MTFETNGCGCGLQVSSNLFISGAGGPKITLNYPIGKEDACRQIFRSVYYSLER